MEVGQEIRDLNELKYQVLTAARMKMAVFWDVTPYILILIGRRFRGAYCLHQQGDRIVALLIKQT
jgi:hypothetical protein